MEYVVLEYIPEYRQLASAMGEYSCNSKQVRLAHICNSDSEVNEVLSSIADKNDIDIEDTLALHEIVDIIRVTHKTHMQVGDFIY